MTASKIRTDDAFQTALGQLKSYASSLSYGDSEDLVQEALTRAIANDVSVDAVPWLRTVMRRIAIDRARRSREVASGDSFDMDGLAIDSGDGPEDQVVSGERAQAVREALAALPPRYREALVAYATAGKASAVAEHMSLSSQATWTLLSRARDRLRDQLERVGFVPGVFVAKLSPWWSNATAGAIAACCVAVAIGGSAVKPADAAEPVQVPKRVALAAAAAIERTEVPEPVPAAVVTLPEPVDVPASEPEQPEVFAEYGARTCPGGAGPAGLRFYFEEGSRPTTIGDFVASLPTQTKNVLVVDEECPE